MKKTMMDKVERATWFAVLSSITKDVLYQFAKNDMSIDVIYSLEKDKLVGKVIFAISTDKKLKEKLTSFINDVEDWGRQHIFLYRSDPKDRVQFRGMTLKQVSDLVNDHKLGIGVNKVRPIFIPESSGYKVFKIIFVEGRRISISWVNKRVLRTRLKEKDYMTESGVEYHAWGTYIIRGISSIDWDLTTGQMMIRISQADNKEIYDIAKGVAIKFMEKVFSINQSSWQPLSIKRAISRIKDCGEVSTKKYNQVSRAGGKQILQSRDKKHGLENDTELSQAGKAVKDQFASTYGNFFWVRDDSGKELEKDIHTTLDSESRSFLIYGIQEEATVRYIIGRIISHAQ